MKDISIVIQAGGKSKRMGTDKGLMNFKSVTLIEYIINQVKVLSDDLLIISNEPNDYKIFGYPVYEDIFHDVGPLAGLHSGLINAKNDPILMLSCDMPFHNIALLKYLIEFSDQNDIVIPKIDDNKFEPFRAIYSKRCLSKVENSIQNNKRRMTSFYNELSIKEISKSEIEKFGNIEHLFYNLNTREDLNKAKLIDWSA